LSKEEKQKYLDKAIYERYNLENHVNKLFTQTPSVEARLTVLSPAKKKQILEFIKELDTQIQQLEQKLQHLQNILVKALEKKKEKKEITEKANKLKEIESLKSAKQYEKEQLEKQYDEMISKQKE
jgi:hypothetical protein